MATNQETPTRRNQDVRRRPPAGVTGRWAGATVRRLASFGIAVLLVAGVTPAGPVAPVAAKTTGDALAWDNTPSLTTEWPYVLAGVPGQTIELHGTGRFGVQWGFAPPATYTALTPAVCTVDGSSLSVLAAGECGIQVSIPGDHLFAASSADTSFTVGAQRIFIGNGGDMPSGTTGDLELLRGAASSGLPLSWTTPVKVEVEGSDPPEVIDNACSIEDTPGGPALRYATTPGTCRVIASQAGDAHWSPAEDVTLEFRVWSSYSTRWSVTSPDATMRTDGTVRTGDLLSVDYAATSEIDTCQIDINGRSAWVSFPGVVAPDKLSCHFEYAIPPLPEARSTGPAACTGPFGFMLDCDGWPEVCVRAAITRSDDLSPFAMDVSDRQAPYDGHCTYTWDEGLPITRPGEYLDFHDVAPGPATYTFASEPQVLSWDQADWGTPAVTLAYNSQIHLELPSWVDTCTGLEIAFPPAPFQQNFAVPACPTWDLTIPAPPAAGSSPFAGGSVAVAYQVDGQSAMVLAPLPVDASAQDFTGPYGSSLPALLPASAADETLAVDASTWEPSFTVFGTATEAPTGCTVTIPDPENWEVPFTHAAVPVGGTCSFSIPTNELLDPGPGAFQGYEVTADFLDGDGQPTREPLRWWSQPRVAGPPASPVMEASPADEAGPAEGPTLVGAGSADPNTVQTAVSVVLAAGTARAGTSAAMVARTVEPCTASRSRAVGLVPVPVYATCALPPGDYVATATATGASGETSTSSLEFTVASPDATKPTVALEAAPASSPTNATSFDVTATFDEPVIGFAAADVTVNGTSTGWIVGDVSGSGTTYTFTVSASTPTDGTLTIVVPADGVTDAATNGNTASSTLSYTIDRTPPTVVVTPPASPTGAETLSYSVVFDEAATGLAEADFAVSGTSTGCLVGTPSGAEGTYAVDVTGCGEGTVILSLNAGSMTDLAGNPGPDSTVAAASITIDRTAPGTSLQCTPGPGPTKATAIACSVTFTEEPGAGSAFASDDVLIGGSATGWTAGEPIGSGTGPHTFDLTGAGADGTLTVAVAAGAVTDGSGNATTASATLALVVDRTLPRTTAISAAPRVGGALSGTSIPLTVTWSGSDNGGSGVARYELAKSSNRGATWRTVSTSLTSASLFMTVPTSGTARFRVRAIDQAGNVGAWATGLNLTPRLTQQSPTLVRYFRPWSPTWSSRFSGGSERYAKTTGASASYTFTGRAIALVTTTAPTRGKVRVYVNGAYVATVDLRSSSTKYRVLAWQKTWSTSATRTVKLVVAGTAGRPRVDLDAFAILR